MHRLSRVLLAFLAAVPVSAHAETFVRFLPIPVSSAFTVSVSIHNKRIDYAVTSDVMFVAANGAATVIAQVTISPQGTAVVPVPQKDLALGGSVVVRCDAPDPSPLDPSLIIERKGNVRTTVAVVPGFRRVFGTALEVAAVVPSAKTRAYLGLANASSDVRTVTIHTTAAAGDDVTNVLTLAPQQTVVTEVTRHPTADGIAIHVDHDGLPARSSCFSGSRLHRTASRPALISQRHASSAIPGHRR